MEPPPTPATFTSPAVEEEDVDVEVI